MKKPDFQRSCLMLFVSLPVRVPPLKFRVPGTSPVAASTRRDVLAPQRLLGTEIGINPFTGAYNLVGQLEYVNISSI